MYHFIVNPHSRSGMGAALWSTVERELISRNISYTVFFTKYQKHASLYTARLTADAKHHTIIVLGGDGTINEVINGIQHFSKITLGYIPTGSSNDFARSYHIPSDPLQALNNILSPSEYRYMDIGYIRYQRKKRRFAVSSGIGFDASICHEAVISKLKTGLNKLHLGKFTYALIALRRLILTAPDDLTLSLDGSELHTYKKGWFCAVMNHPCEGGGLRFCPDASPEDGFLDVIVVSGLPALGILLVLPFAFWGRHTKLPGIHIFRCKSVSITAGHALPLHTDGEPIFLQHDFSASLEKEKLKIIIS